MARKAGEPSASVAPVETVTRARKPRVALEAVPAPVPTFDDAVSVSLPLGAPPQDLLDQRTWAEVRKLQIETERSLLDLMSARRREPHHRFVRS